MISVSEINVVEILASATIALVAVFVSHWLADRRKFSSNFNGLCAELRYNLAVLTDLTDILEKDEKLEKNSGSLEALLIPKLHRFAFDYFVVGGHLMKISEDSRSKLIEIYRLLDIINAFVDRYNETKYGVLLAMSNIKEIRKVIRLYLKNILIPIIKKSILEFLEKKCEYEIKILNKN